MQAILGTKLGMTQIFREDGRVEPVTVIKAGPCVVVQRKTADGDGYEAVQLGLVENMSRRKINKPMNGHFKKAGVAPLRRLVEFRVAPEDELQPGDEVSAGVFGADDVVEITAVSKGKGFQGVMKRHGHSGGRATHGSMFHRAPGSIGQASDPSRVFPGVKLPGRMGGKSITVRNLTVVKVDEEKGLIFVRGAVPGPNSGFVSLTGHPSNPVREPAVREDAEDSQVEAAEAEVEATADEAADVSPETSSEEESTSGDADGGDKDQD